MPVLEYRNYPGTERKGRLSHRGRIPRGGHHDVVHSTLVEGRIGKPKGRGYAGAGAGMDDTCSTGTCTRYQCFKTSPSPNNAGDHGILPITIQHAVAIYRYRYRYTSSECTIEHTCTRPCHGRVRTHVRAACRHRPCMMGVSMGLFVFQVLQYLAIPDDVVVSKPAQLRQQSNHKINQVSSCC